MLGVRVKEGESFEAAHRRFRRAVDKAGNARVLRNRAFHLKRSVLKQRKQAAAKKRLLKRLSREQQMFAEGSRDRRH